MQSTDIATLVALLEGGNTAGAIAGLKAFLAKPDDAYDIEAAARAKTNDELEIDGAPLFSDGQEGCWVSAWVWVPREETDETEEA